ncbi:restriction endonuclease subunit S [Streptococcus suis]|uniref:restriction endonuclease subunit S n=1 Tax=Streptococcus suis TaxID=1307 RepID=UPI0014791F45
MSDVSWQIKSLSELGRFSRGKSKHRPRNDKKLFTNGTYPLIQTGDIKNANLYVTKNSDYYNEFGLSQSKLWEQGTLCITIAANIAETAILSYPMCFPDSVVGFNAHKNESSELFVYYVFELIKKEIQKTSSGSIQDNINIDYLTKLKFKVPNKDYQDSIVNLLSTIDKKILINNQINEELEAMAKTLYDYWFVQFDFPDENGKPYKSSGGKMVYNDQLKREIPEGWGVKQLGEVSICHDSRRVPLSSKDRENKNGIIPYYGATGIMDYIDDFIFEGDYILMAEDGSVMTSEGKPILQRITGKTWVNNHAHVLEPTNEYSCKLLLLSLKDISVLQIKTGSIQMKITQENMNKILLPDIGRDLLSKINEVLLPIDEKQLKLLKQNQELTQLRDWLLPMLMNGQVRVE